MEDKILVKNLDKKSSKSEKTDKMDKTGKVVSVEKIMVEDIKIELNTAPFNDPEIAKKIRSLLPSRDRQRISFHLINSGVPIANAIRRVIQGELDVKCLKVTVSDIKTDDVYIICDELAGRIGCIPIDQDIPVGTEFALNVANSDNQRKVILSSSIQLKPNSKVKEAWFAETVNLFQLNAGKYIEISSIRVVSGRGYGKESETHGKGAHHCLTHDIEYEFTDFIIVTFLSEKFDFIRKRVKAAELAVILDKHKVKYMINELFSKKILVIPNKAYILQVPNYNKRLENFDIVLQNDDPVEKTLAYSDLFLKSYSSAETIAYNIFLGITTSGNIDPKSMIVQACENIQNRLKIVSNEIQESYKKINEPLVKTEPMVTIIQYTGRTKIIVRGEDFTISQILRYGIFELDPNMGLINVKCEHIQNRSFILNIIHPNPIKLTLDAIIVYTEKIEKIRKYFVN